ncbi:hypothetical protein Tco_0714971 [Tanacetum coccineum]
MGGISIYLTSYTLADMHSIFTKWIVSVPGIGGSLAVVAAMHSRTHRFEVKLMDLEPHDPYAKTAKRVAVLAEEQRKTTKKEKLDNKRQHTQDVAGPSSYSSQPRSKRSNIRKRSVDTSSSHKMVSEQSRGLIIIHWSSRVGNASA